MTAAQQLNEVYAELGYQTERAALLTLEEVRYGAVQLELNRSGSNVSTVARTLGISRDRCYNILKRRGGRAAKVAMASLLAVAVVGCGTVKGTVESRELSVESQTVRATPPIPPARIMAAPVIVAPPKPPPVLTLRWSKMYPYPEIETQIYTTSDLRNWTLYGTTNGNSYPIQMTEQQQFFRVRNKLVDHYSDWNQ